MKKDSTSSKNNNDEDSKVLVQATHGSSCYGYLDRKNAVSKWTSYWFTLISTTLNCYKGPNEATPYDTLALKGYDVRAVGCRNGRFLFSLSAGLLKTYYYSCSSLEARTSWLYALSQAIIQANGKPKIKKPSLLRKIKKANENQSLPDNLIPTQSEHMSNSVESTQHDQQTQENNNSSPKLESKESSTSPVAVEDNDHTQVDSKQVQPIFNNTESGSERNQSSVTNSPKMTSKNPQEPSTDKHQTAKDKLVSQLKAQKKRLINSLNNSDVRLPSATKTDKLSNGESEPVS